MGDQPVLNIGKLASGGEGYYLSTVASGVEDYYTGSGEAPGYWSGSAAGAFGLSGEVAADDLHALLAGVDPATGQRLVDPVRRAHPRSLLATAPLRAALGDAADERGVDVAGLFGGDSKARRWLAESGRSETMAVERVERVAAAAGVDLAAVYDAEELAEAREHRGRRVDVRVPAFDCTFRAPKSVSLLFGLGDPAAAERVRLAHDRAVEQAVGYLEREAGAVRRGRNGVDRLEGSGFAVAAFRHRSSRSRDPLLHTHALVANLVQGEDGNWGAVASAGLYTHAKTAGALYQAALRDELTAALGVEWGPVRNGYADVAGVPEVVIRAFSQRRAAIEAEMARRGVSGARAAQVATLATRAAKPGPDEAATEPVMRDEWQARGRMLGFGRDEVAALLGLGREPQPPVPLGDVADRLLGEEGLTARASSFTRRDAVQAWCAALPAGAPVGEVERLADALLGGADSAGHVVPLLPTPAAAAGGRDDVEQLVAAVAAAVPDGADRLVTSLPLRDALAAGLDGGLTDADVLAAVIGDDLAGARDRVAVVVARAQRAAERAPGAARLDRRSVLRRGDGRVVATFPGERRYSTADLLAVEQQLVEGALARAAASVGVATEDAVAAALARRPSIGADQAAMVERITRSGAGVEVVVGPAGTGKTFALDAARAAWEASGHRVIGAALSAQARNELEAGAGIDGYTLAALLGQLDDAATRGGRRGAPLDACAVVILDEAGMVGSRQLARLLAHAATHDAKVVLVGDDRQLPEIDAGGAFRALTRRLHPVELAVNRRQRDPVQVAALGELRAGDPVAGAAAFTDAGLVWVGQTAEDVRERLVSDWWAARDEGRAGVMLAGRNADIDDLNARARARRVASGELTGPEVDAAVAALQVGDEVVATANQHVRSTDGAGAGGRVQLANGARGVITAVHPATGSVDAQVQLGDAERTVRIGPRLLAAGQLRHGYAVTCHKAQGLTTEEVFVLGSDQLYREWLYTALSRARHANRLYLVAGHLDLADDEAGHPAAIAAPSAPPLDELARMAVRSRAQDLALESADTAALAARPPADLDAERERLRQRLGPAPRDRIREHERLYEQRAAATEAIATAADRRATAQRTADELMTGLRRLTRRRDTSHARAAAACAAADEQAWQDRLAALDERAAQLHNARPARWPDDRSDDLARYAALTDARALRASAAVQAVDLDPPDYVRERLGARPDAPDERRVWRRAVHALETHLADLTPKDRAEALEKRPTNRTRRDEPYEATLRAVSGAQEHLRRPAQERSSTREAG